MYIYIGLTIERQLQKMANIKLGGGGDKAKVPKAQVPKGENTAAVYI